MLRSAIDILGYNLKALDGEIGKSKDFLFDDQHWAVRYLMAETGRWLQGKRVLISPISIEQPDRDARVFPVNLTKQQIEDAPNEGEDMPVSHKFEIEFFKYHQWPYYWNGGYPWGILIPMERTNMNKPAGRDSLDDIEGDKNLRSLNEVKGYNIQATDGHIGHVENLILDDETWTIRYLVVDTRNWLPGKRVLVSPSWAEKIDWAKNTVDVNMSRDQIKNSPDYDDSKLMTRKFENSLFKYYGVPGYWL
ncbi:MAG: PRC-barrel domain-containing protein [Candidatus Marinimicrobia bacterium]|nr:PRC-barrel domain-containing protein [Candidatus Neomarinimicrobiota bacterium]